MRVPLPTDNIKTYLTDDGELRNTLSLYDLKWNKDSGTYAIIVRNHCGNSTEFVTINLEQGMRK